MNKSLVLALFAVLSVNAIAPAMAKETNPQVLADYKKHQAKKQKSHTHQSKKKAHKIERVPRAKIRNCHMRRYWVSPNRIREAKECEVMK